MTIYSLRHQADRTSAMRYLAPSRITAIFHRWWNGRLRGVAEIYIPYRLYKVSFEDRGSRLIQYYALDSASGTLDPYEFGKVP